MAELDDAIGKLLNDPGAMAQVMDLAQSLRGMLPAEGNAAPAPAGTERHAALCQALAPFLSPRRRSKLERAMQLARLSSLLGVAMQQMGSETEGG